MDYTAWAREGGRIGALGKASAWWIGDWLRYGTEKWGERYAKAAKITGYDPKTLRNLRYVASRFDPSLRRDKLTWSHHSLLASLPPDEQAYWLDRSVADGFSVEDLRMELRLAQKQLHGGANEIAPADDAGPTIAAEAQTARNSDLVVSAHSPTASSSTLLCPVCGCVIDPVGLDHRDP